MNLHRACNAKTVATLGPASSSAAMVRALFLAGVDVFRLNFSHGTAEEHRARFAVVRDLERETGRPIGILADLILPRPKFWWVVGCRPTKASTCPTWCCR